MPVQDSNNTIYKSSTFKLSFDFGHDYLCWRGNLRVRRGTSADVCIGSAASKRSGSFGTGSPKLINHFFITDLACTTGKQRYGTILQGASDNASPLQTAATHWENFALAVPG